MSRKSKQKACILGVVKGDNSHPTAEWIYEQVKREIPNISLGTVYRNLKLLMKEGEIAEVGFAGIMRRFDGNTQNHYHFRCEHCGRIADIDEPVNIESDHKIAQKTGLQVDYHVTEFRGLCKTCQSLNH